MNSIQLKAMGKINLGLDVVRRRPDGYHEVKMVMQTVDLYDHVCLTKRDDANICVASNLSFLPVDKNNIAYKAARLLMDTCGFSQGVNIYLEKHIPVAAGMAGGSTDAAAVLCGMNQLFELGLSDEKLKALGVTLGADVPYCVMGGTALSEGIGEVLTPLPPVPECYIVLAKPDISVSTKWVYENLHADTLTGHPDIDSVMDGIYTQNLVKICDHLENVLESVTARRFPVIEQIKRMMIEQGALNALMSGSGPTVFGIFDDENTAQKAYEMMKQSDLAGNVFLVRPMNRR